MLPEQAPSGTLPPSEVTSVLSSASVSTSELCARSCSSVQMSPAEVHASSQLSPPVAPRYHPGVAVGP